jgi:hypothetical protein
MPNVLVDVCQFNDSVEKLEGIEFIYNVKPLISLDRLIRKVLDGPKGI